MASVTADVTHHLATDNSGPRNDLATAATRTKHKLGNVLGDDSPAPSGHAAGGTGGGGELYHRSHMITVTLTNASVPGTLLHTIVLDWTLVPLDGKIRFLKYRITDLKITGVFTGALGMAAGAWFIASCPDPENVIPTKPADIIDYCSALSGSQLITARTSCELSLKLDQEKKWIRKGSSPRLSEFGHVYIVAMTPTPSDAAASSWEVFISASIEYSDAGVLTTNSLATASVSNLFHLDDGKVSYTLISTPIGQFFAVRVTDDLADAEEGSELKVLGKPPIAVLQFKLDEEDKIAKQESVIMASGHLYSDGDKRYFCVPTTITQLVEYTISGTPTFILDRPWADYHAFVYTITNEVLGVYVPLASLTRLLPNRGVVLAEPQRDARTIP